MLLIHFTYHQGVLNSLGLRRAGFGEGYKDPPGGWVGRTRRGRLDGGVFERCFGQAEAVARAALLANDREGWFARANAYQERVLAAGITHVCDAAVPPNLESLYREWQRRGELRVGVTMMPIADAMLADPTARLDGATTGPLDGRLAVGPLKLFLDGGVHCAMCFSLRDAVAQFATLRRQPAARPVTSPVAARLAATRAPARRRHRPHRDALLRRRGARCRRRRGHRARIRHRHARGRQRRRPSGARVPSAGAPPARCPRRIDHFFFVDQR